MKSGTVGKTGFLRLGFERRGSRTILAELERRAPYMVQRALYCDQEMPDLACVFLITTTGCLLQGDRLALDVRLGPRAQAHVTTQSATKIHAMDANYAAQTQTITLADDAYLEFLPDPVIPHRQRAFRQRHADLHRSDRDASLFGDHSARSQASSSGRMLRRHRDVASRPPLRAPMAAHCSPRSCVIEPQRYPMRQTGVMDSFDVFGNVILCTPKDKADRIYAARGGRRRPCDAGWRSARAGCPTMPA